jgi:hypothetical protein
MQGVQDFSSPPAPNPQQVRRNDIFILECNLGMRPGIKNKRHNPSKKKSYGAKNI